MCSPEKQSVTVHVIRYRVRSADGKWRHKAETVNTTRRKDAERILSERLREVNRGLRLPVETSFADYAANHWENAWAKFERAEIDIEAFDQLFAAESRLLGAEVRGRDVLPLLSGDLRPEMVEALRRVKASFKTGCITNNLPANAIGSHSGRTLYVAEVMVLFDHVIESAKIGLRKPDPRIYRLMVETLQVDPKNCVYLDDLGVNLKPAREMGMTTIKVLDAGQAIAELEAATGLELRQRKE